MDHNIDHEGPTSQEFIDDPFVIDSVGKYLVRFLEEARKNHFPILSKISDTLAIQIWISACQFINKQLENDRAVQITQLGTFTFSSKRLDIGNNKFIVVQRPVFLLSERLAQTHGITYTKHHVSGEIPVVKMNFTAIAIAMGRERDLVEGAIREIMQALSRVIAYREPVQFVFYNIGYLVVRDFRARVKFTPGFIKRMDGTGELSRMLESKRGKRSKTASKKANNGKKQDQQDLCIPARAKTSSGRVELRRPCEPRSQSLECLDEADVLDVQNEPVMCTPRSNDGVPTAGLFSTSDRKAASPSQVRLKSADSVASSIENADKEEHLAEYNEYVKQLEQNQNIANNLSYVAFQRQQLNEEKRQREAQADAILQRYQDSKDQTSMHRERLQNELARTRAKDVAAFNLKTCLEASEDDLLKARRASSAKAYIFKKRPLTPARFQKQHEYSNALAGQVDAKASKLLSASEQLDKSERLEQQELKSEIEMMKNEARARNKKNQKNYRKSLASQIRVKSQITKRNDAQEELAEPSIPTVPYFGRNHITDDKAREEKQRAKALFKAQLAMASEKRQSAIKKHLQAQQQEAQVLRRTHTELFADQKQAYESSVDRRQSLEENWIRHAHEKKKREQQHQEFTKLGRQLTEKNVHMHDKYAVCFQEQPTGYHSGRFKSNIWRESRYIPGSRLMV